MRLLYLLSVLFICIATKESIAQPLSELETVGTAKLRVLFFDIYTSELKTESGEYTDGIRPIQLKIIYERNIKSSALIKQTKKEWDAQMANDKNQLSWIKTLESIWPNIESGDTLTFELYKNGKNQFFYNERAIGSVNDPNFGENFLDIWLSPKTTRPKIRREMLGNN